MKKFFRGLFYATCAIYPILVFTCLVILELPVRVLSLCVAGIALGMFLSFTAGSGSEKKNNELEADSKFSDSGCGCSRLFSYG